MSNVAHATEEDVVKDSLKSKWTECDDEGMRGLVVRISEEEDTYSQRCCSPLKMREGFFVVGRNAHLIPQRLQDEDVTTSRNKVPK